MTKQPLLGLLAATALKEGNDYVVNGEKWFSSSADGADFAIVMAVTNPNASATCGCGNSFAV